MLGAERPLSHLVAASLTAEFAADVGRLTQLFLALRGRELRPRIRLRGVVTGLTEDTALRKVIVGGLNGLHSARVMDIHRGRYDLRRRAGDASLCELGVCTARHLKLLHESGPARPDRRPSNLL